MLGANPRTVGFRSPPLTSAGNTHITDTAVGAASSSAPGNYLNDLTSWSQALQFVLSLFAIFVLVRYCLRRWLPWLTRIDAKNAAYSTTNPNFSQRLLHFDKHVHSEKRPIRGNHLYGKHFLHHTCGSQLRHRKPPQPWFYRLPEMMDEKQRDRSFGAAAGTKGAREGVRRQHPAGIDQDVPVVAGRNIFALDPAWNKNISIDADRQLISRPPPAPPLTPPDLSSGTVYTLDGGPINRGGPESFMHQPNPDYTSSFSPNSISHPGWPDSSTGSHRRSFSKTLPIGIPRHHSSVSNTSDSADLTISPNSYPPTSPIFPPPPPVGYEESEDLERNVRSSTRPGPSEVEARGEYVSVVNSHGDSWTRHTRVYGGGVCLACAAAGDDGGFYGANVRPEEMR